MPTHQLQQITIKTSSREELVDITGKVQQAVSAAGAESGMVWVYSPHTTAGVTIQENADPDVRRDMLDHLERLVPQRPDFKHMEGNSDAHIKTSMMGPSQAVPLDRGRMTLGTWQAIYLCEFDGPRTRRVLVKVLG